MRQRDVTRQIKILYFFKCVEFSNLSKVIQKNNVLKVAKLYNLNYDVLG